MSELLGIFQSDLVIQSALKAAMADLRRNPYLLDYAFASLVYDDLTKSQYGAKAVEQGKKWFLNTEIPIFINTRIDEAKFPCISIVLMESNEEQNTLADVHYETHEELAGTSEVQWEILIGPFNPLSYDFNTGKMVIPSAALNDIAITPGLVLVDSSGNSYEILDSANGDNSFYLEDNLVADFANSTIRIKAPSKLISIESANFKEVYSIGCHAQNAPIYLTYLHSIVSFILLRYRQSLLEARGFERTSIASGVFARNEYTESELTFSRMINITGYVRQYWPKTIGNKLVSVNTVNDIDGQLIIDGSPIQDTNDVLWNGNVEDD